MTSYYSTRDLGITRDTFALPIQRRVAIPCSLAAAEAAAEAAARLSTREIGLIRSLIEDNRTILWLDSDQTVKTWDMEDGISNKGGVILVL